LHEEEEKKGKRYYRQWSFNVNYSSVCYRYTHLFKKRGFFWINNFMKKKKELTKTQHMENNAIVLNLVARLMVAAFLLAVIIYSLPL